MLAAVTYTLSSTTTSSGILLDGCLGTVALQPGGCLGQREVGSGEVLFTELYNHWCILLLGIIAEAPTESLAANINRNVNHGHNPGWPVIGDI